jgi:hypothetical protein
MSPTDRGIDIDDEIVFSSPVFGMEAGNGGSRHGESRYLTQSSTLKKSTGSSSLESMSMKQRPLRGSKAKLVRTLNVTW